MTTIYLARGPEWYELWLTRPRYKKTEAYWTGQPTASGYVTLISENAWNRLKTGVELEVGECREVRLAVSIIEGACAGK